MVENAVDDVGLYNEQEYAVEGVGGWVGVVNNVFPFSKEFAKACIENVWLTGFMHNNNNNSDVFGENGWVATVADNAHVWQ